MFTNADDMVKGLKFFLGAPNLLTQVQLPPPVLEEVMNPRLLLPAGFRVSLDKSSYVWPVPDISVGYAMGFFRNVYRGEPTHRPIGIILWCIEINQQTHRVVYLIKVKGLLSWLLKSHGEPRILLSNLTRALSFVTCFHNPSPIKSGSIVVKTDLVRVLPVLRASRYALP